MTGSLEAAEPDRLEVGPRELEWLYGAVGLNSMPERGGLKALVAKLPSLRRFGYPEGLLILKEGVRGEDFYILYRGAASVEKGKQSIVELVPGDFFGEVGFLYDAPRIANVRAGGSCEAFRIHCEDFDKLVSRVSGLSAVLRQVARQRMRKLADPK